MKIYVFYILIILFCLENTLDFNKNKNIVKTTRHSNISSLYEVLTLENLKNIIKTKEKVLIFFYAEWCSHW